MKYIIDTKENFDIITPINDTFNKELEEKLHSFLSTSSLKKRIAIIGAGISGLGCAYALRQHRDLDITVYEGGAHIGGHSNTVNFKQ